MLTCGPVSYNFETVMLAANAALLFVIAFAPVVLHYLPKAPDRPDPTRDRQRIFRDDLRYK